MFTYIDQQWLNFLCTQQKKLYVTLLNGMEDALSMNNDHVDLNQIGQ